MIELDSLAWNDEDGDGFKIQAGEWQGKEAIACIHVYDELARDFWGVFVLEADARALIDWLQARLGQTSLIKVYRQALVDIAGHENWQEGTKGDIARAALEQASSTPPAMPHTGVSVNDDSEN